MPPFRKEGSCRRDSSRRTTGLVNSAPLKFEIKPGEQTIDLGLESTHEPPLSAAALTSTISLLAAVDKSAGLAPRERSPAVPHFTDQLAAAVRRTGNAVCVGLDPRWEQLPWPITTGREAEPNSQADAYLDFCCGVIDVVAPLVPVVKPQMAFEELGPAVAGRWPK